MNPTEYVTVRAGDFATFDAEVNKKLHDGFVLFGSPYVADSGEFLVCQAMTRDSTPEKRMGAGFH